MSDAFEELVENFEFLDDWEDRYRYVIELGRDMPALDDALKTPATKVDGCASQVWLLPRFETDAAGVERLAFEGDSDAHIVRGLIAILRALYQGRTREEAAALDAQAALARIDLDSHISAQRSNGLRAMIGRLRGAAEA